LKKETARLKQQVLSSGEQDRKEKQLRTKTNDELAYLADKLNRTVREADELK